MRASILLPATLLVATLINLGQSAETISDDASPSSSSSSFSSEQTGGPTLSAASREKRGLDNMLRLSRALEMLGPEEGSELPMPLEDGPSMDEDLLPFMEEEGLGLFDAPELFGEDGEDLVPGEGDEQEIAKRPFKMLRLGKRPFKMLRLGKRPFKMLRLGKRPMSMLRLGKRPMSMLRLGKRPMSMLRLGKRPMSMLRLGKRPMSMLRLGKRPISKVRLLRLGGNAPNSEYDSSSDDMYRFGAQ